MNSKLTFLFLTIVYSSQLFSQTANSVIDIKWGEEFRNSGRSFERSMIGFDDSGIFGIAKEGRGLSLSVNIEHYDHGMNRTKAVEIDLGRGSQQRYFHSTTYLGDQIQLYTTHENRKSKLNSLSVQTINKNSLVPKSAPRQLAVINYKGERRSNAGSFNIRVSRDSSKVLVYYQLPYNKKEAEKFGVSVFDSEMNLLWDKIITLPYSDEYFAFSGFKLSNVGGVHLLGKVFREKRQLFKGNLPNYDFILLSYTNNGANATEYPIRLQNKYPSEMAIAINDQQELICAGFYTESRTGGISGSYYLKLDTKSKEVLSESYKKFEVDFITMALKENKAKRMTKKAGKGRDLEIPDLDLREIVLRDDGGAVLIGEQFSIRVTSTTSSNGQTRTTYHYNHGDIIVININPSGTIEWATKVAKNQFSTNDGGQYLSFATMVAKDNLYFVYNDFQDNLFFKEGDKIKKFQMSLFKKADVITSLVQVNNNGSQKRFSMYRLNDSKGLTTPKLCHQISSDELIILAERNKRQRFAKVVFK